MLDFLTRPIDPDLSQGIWAILMLGMAVLMWGRFRNMRRDIDARKAKQREADLKAQQRKETPGPWTDE